MVRYLLSKPPRNIERAGEGSCNSASEARFGFKRVLWKLGPGSLVPSAQVSDGLPACLDDVSDRNIKEQGAWNILFNGNR